MSESRKTYPAEHAGAPCGMQPPETATKTTRRPNYGAKLCELKQRFREIGDLAAIRSMLSWDHATYMPKEGAAARARERALLSKLRHERLTAPELGRLIDDLTPYGESLPYDSDDASLIRVARRDFEKAIRVSADFAARAAEHGSASYDAWTRARPANDFAVMRPFLEKAIDLSREYAEFFAPYQHIADPLIDASEQGMTAALIRALFAALREELLPLVADICSQPPLPDDCLRGFFPEKAQLDFGRMAVERLGYDFNRGRLDNTHHPFCCRLSAGDVRITTRVDEGHFGETLFAAMHEAGHALYEQGVARALDGTPLGCGVSAGVHESQSRLWENIIGRSRSFWAHFYPLLRQSFPDALQGTDMETFYRAINKVERSLIRTEADEVTYNLHIMMRFDLELALLEGQLQVKDLPEVWIERMKSDLGVAPADDRDGCLQDVHWYGGMLGGGFQSYTIGNILSAQFYAAAAKAHPEIAEETAQGEFGTLAGWLRQHIYEHGRKFSPSELIARAAGEALSIKPYLAYLRQKYAELYHLPPAGRRPQPAN